MGLLSSSKSKTEQKANELGFQESPVGAGLVTDTKLYSGATLTQISATSDPGLVKASEGIISDVIAASGDSTAAILSAHEYGLEYAATNLEESLYFAGDVFDTSVESLGYLADTSIGAVSDAFDTSTDAIVDTVDISNSLISDVVYQGFSLAGDLVGVNVGLVDKVTDQIADFSQRESLNNDARISELSQMVVKVGGALAVAAVLAMFFKR